MYQIDPATQAQTPLQNTTGHTIHPGPVQSIPYTIPQTIPTVPFAQAWNQQIPQVWNQPVPQTQVWNQQIPQAIGQLPVSYQGLVQQIPAIPQTQVWNQQIPQTLGQMPLSYQGLVQQIPLQTAIQPMPTVPNVILHRVPQLHTGFPTVPTLQPQVQAYQQPSLGYTSIPQTPWGVNPYQHRY